MSVYNIYDKNSVLKYTATNLEYHDSWMGEEYVLVDISSPTPLSLEIGDYLTYREQRYSIYNIPSALKQARSGSYGDAFTYSKVKMSACSNELTEIRFHDIVLGDNQMHYTSLSSFPFYCETVDDLVDRIQANTDRSGAETWMFITPNKTRTLQRCIVYDPTLGEWVPDTERQAVADELWESVFGEDTPDNSKEKKDVTISVDNIHVWDAIAHIKNSFGLNFFVKGRTVVVGSSGIPAAHIFQYGKGNGLSTIERVAEQDQQIVTKLYAYGSEKNLPTRYYAELYSNVFTNIDEVKSHSVLENSSVLVCALQLSYYPKYFNWQDTEDFPMSEEKPYIAEVSIGGTTVRCLVYHNNAATSDTRAYIQIEYERTVSKQYFESDKSKVDSVIDSVLNGERVVYFVNYINKIEFPAANKEYLYLPNNMAVNVLMLPGFPKYALSELCQCSYDSELDETSFFVRKSTDVSFPSTPFLKVDGDHTMTFSTDRLRPWIMSGKSAELGIKEGDIHFTEDNDDNGLQEVHPSIEGMTRNDIFGDGSDERLDELYNADVITDNGVFADGATIQNFHVILKNLGFDLRQAYANAGNSMKLSMKDGFCGGREFSVKNVTAASNDRWDIEVEREIDDALQLYFPYSDAAAHGETPSQNEAYQLRPADHFVLTDIQIEDTRYIWAASVELLRKSIVWLTSNDYTRFTYTPKIDEIFMAREHESAVAGTSLHDTLRAGMMISFEDTDFGIDGSVFIDQLTIKEDGNNGIPTYDVALRNDKQVGTLQKIQNQISTLYSQTSGFSGTSINQIKRLIENAGLQLRDWAAQQFLSKVSADIAAGKITFNEGLALLLDFGISKDGDAILNDIIAKGLLKSDNYVSGLTGWKIDHNGNMEAETLRLRSALEVDELRINRQQAQEGDTIFSDNDQIESVQEVIDETDQSVSYILTLKEKWEGYFTAQQYGNIIRGKINTLAAKEAGVSDYTDSQYQASQGQDAGGNLYYTSFMQVIATHNTAPSSIGVNQIQVVLFGDNAVPMTRNYPPCPLMAIARYGCIDYSAAYIDDPHYEDIVASIKRRQQFFMLSSSDGRIVKLTGVDKPILESYNFGSSFGTLPEFVQNYANVRERIIAGRDYLYAQGVVVGDFIKIDINGQPVSTIVNCGDWVNGGTGTPTVGSGIYLCNEFNETTQQYEVHQVRHSNGTWQCLQHIPVTVEGTPTYFEPKWNSPYWKLVDGNGNLTIEFASSKGFSFRRGAVNTVITPHLFYGNVDITADIAATYFSWTRESESGKTDADRTWDAQHAYQKTLTLTNADMPDSWSSSNKAIFTCIIQVNDGQTTVIVDNQIIS